ncbi:hypothetical protein CHGG_05964 [Chaetomium globosum CBS 148.51]|uniref:C2H2-type domain-containing protein n=1 Tax=Chaetomium globosum (strain ATCC 6205 / CBS 148.51 / DSM 1962 / NBRC 6347 / NRRL 1970) TaxID=306901 RepID=Q2H5V1_CHAGB|nr:uncharacterized protein CHGG_05964 [Chaetomium globosum CBS 148.51]EAQ89345.1 hypothetical protein CHGG_05964 [Chaetomium globosum CBS 148.51]
MTMTMTDDHSRRRFGPLSNFHHMPSYSSQPHFSDPWSSYSPTGPAPQGGNQQHPIYAGNQESAGLPHLNIGSLPRQPPNSQHPQHPQHSATTGSSTSMAPYGSLPVTAGSAASAPISGVYRQHEMLSMPQDAFGLNRLQQPTSSAAYDASAYTSSASPVTASYPPASASPYEQLGYAPAQMRGTFAIGQEDNARRYSQQPLQTDDRRTFQDALEASQGMLSMSQDTPRNIYDVRNRARGSADSYGFPSTHSSTSSISSAGFSGYYGGSVDGSVSDYSAAGSDIESLSGRTLPRPQGLMSSQPPAPQSMMGSFSSRVSSSAQKKHKCKVCDKRFTRPSSLQTHMYSHTGEKPFGCEVEGCGRRFSVVSNLRRHKKVHKRGGETPSDTGSETHESP